MASTAPVGYGAVAACMSSDRDLSIYRRFGALNSRNLLYLQAELQELEQQLNELDAESNDVGKGNDTWAKSRSLHALNRAGGKHLEVVLRIRVKLDEYNRALQLQTWVLNLKSPEVRPRSNLTSFMKANPTEMAYADASWILEQHRSDLVALASEEREPMSKFLGQYLHRLFQSKDDKQRSGDGQMRYFSDGRIRQLTRIAAIVLSSILPIISIVVLYFIKSQLARLGAVVAFAVLSSSALALFSNAKNGEIIGATAAYAAVQVVFVSGNSGPG